MNETLSKFDLQKFNVPNPMTYSTTSSYGHSTIAGIKPLQSPSVTPIKPLPFSPSKFFNSPSLNMSFDTATLPASTPIRNAMSHKVNFSVKKMMFFVFKCFKHILFSYF